MRSLKSAFSRVLVALGLLLGFAAPDAKAQGVAGFSDYFILGQDDHVYRFMSRVQNGEGSQAFPSPARLNSVASATSTQDGQRITFDHWEDGMEPDITNPVQATTLVLGDGINANGRVCDWSRDPRVFPCTGNGAHDDSIYIGIPMSFASDRGLTGACASPYLTPPSITQVTCSFPVSPNLSTITRAGAVATVTTAVAHGLAVGQVIQISGAVETNFNGTFSIVSVPTTTTFTYAVANTGPTAASGSFRVRFPSIRFDGGDRVYSIGGSLSIAQIQDPGTPLIGGGTELLARELVANAVSYSVPVGEDLHPGTNNVFQSIKYAALDIVAFDDNTSITVTSPGAGGGTRSVVLHRGQSYSTCGDFGAATGGLAGGAPSPCTTGVIDGPPPPSGADNRGVFSGLALKITAGTKVATTGPLNVLIFTGGGSAAGAQYQTRHYATLPDILHATDYVMTAPGVAAAGRNTDLFIYNPSPTAAINVSATRTTGGTNVINIPANSVVSYRNAVGAFVPAQQTVRLTSNRQFWGLSVYDSTNLFTDWGHAWLGTRFLATDYTAAYSPGTQLTPITSLTQPAGANPTVTSITRTAANVTVNTAAAHGLTVGTRIVVEGAVSAPNNFYNGTFLIASTPTATSFTYAAGGTSSVSPATGTVLASRAVVVVTDVPHVLVDPSGVLVAGAGAPFDRSTATTAYQISATSVAYAANTNGAASASSGSLIGVCADEPTTQPCDSYNRNPIWVAGTQNNTQVKVDFDADSLWDFVDLNSDGCPDSGVVVSGVVCETPITLGACTAPAANSCTYTVNAPGSAGTNSLRIWDPYDMDNAGTRIVTTRPVALSWGQDPDQGIGSDPSPDNGYTVYPAIALDLVLGLQKSVEPARVPLAGGVADYTIRVFAGDYGPLNFVAVKDRLPTGLTCSAYVAGSTVITYPDNTTTTADPICNTGAITSLTAAGTTATVTSNNHGFLVGERLIISGATSAAPNTYNGSFTVVSVIDANQFTVTLSAVPGSASASGTIVMDGGRARLKWNPTPATLNPGESTYVRYKINIPASAASRTLVNDAEAFGTLGTGSVFNPKDTASLSQSDLDLVKTVSSAIAAVGDVLTYTIEARNSSLPEANVTLTDAIPNFTSFVAGSITSTTLPRSVTQITQVNGIATATTAAPHGWFTGTTVTIAGATVGAYNGTKTLATFPVTNVVRSGAVATVTIAGGHGWVNGDTIRMTGATDPLYNGTFLISGVTATTFQYTMTGVPAVSPAAGAPSAAQLSPNKFSFVIAAATASPAGGTITVAGPATAYAGTYDVGSTSVIWTGPAAVNVSNLTRAGTAVSATTAAAHGLVVGQYVTIAGAVSAPNNFYNGTFLVETVGSATTFTYTATGTSSVSPATGTITSRAALSPNATLRVSFQVRVDNGTVNGTVIPNVANYSSGSIASFDSNIVNTTIIGPELNLTKSRINSPRTVTSLTRSGTTANATSPAHGFVVGQYVTIAGAISAAPNSYNGTFLVASVPTPNTFTYIMGGTPGTSPATGTITALSASTVPGAVLDYELLLTNTGTGPARAIGIVDNLASSLTTYVPGSLTFSVNGGPFATRTDATDADQLYFTGGGTVLNFTYYRPVVSITSGGTTTATVTTSIAHGFANGNSVTIAGSDDPLYNGTFNIAGVTATTFTYTMAGIPAAAAVGPLTAELNPAFVFNPGSTLRLRFSVRVNPGTNGFFATNQAQAFTTGQPPTTSNLVQVPIVSPPGSVAMTKSSSAGGTAVPGQTITYTVVVQNGTNVTQTGIQIADPLPPGTTFVANSVNVATGSPVFRATEYYVGPGLFTGATFNLRLNQSLATNYFVVTQGSDTTAATGPNVNYIRLTGDPYATGSAGAFNGIATTSLFVAANGLTRAGTTATVTTTANHGLVVGEEVTIAGATSDPTLYNGTFTVTSVPTLTTFTYTMTGTPATSPATPTAVNSITVTPNRLAFTRGAAGASWTGVITVVECLTSCATNGFELLDAGAITIAGVATTQAAASDVAWTGGELPRIMLMGGFQGAGCSTADADTVDTKGCQAQLVPTGTNTLTANRNSTGAASVVAATNTVMVLRWGTAWTTQRVTWTGVANGGADVNAAGEYNTQAIASVTRANTWVWGSGFTGGTSQRDASEGVVLTLGNGVAQGAAETTVALGKWNNAAANAATFTGYVLTHPSASVEYAFKASAAGTDPTDLQYDQAMSSTSGARFALSYQGMSQNDNNYPQSMFSARFVSSNTIRLERQQAAGTFAAWTQSVNFSNIASATSSGSIVGRVPPNLVVPADGFTLTPGATLTLTYQVTVNASPGVSQIVNTATFTSTQTPTPGIAATVTDNVAIPAVRVEPNNAGFVAVPTTPAGNTILFTQGVTNLGSTSDSFTLTLNIEKNGWKLELIDPATGTVLATDTNGDGIWDGGAIISTGSLAVGATKQYTIRATVPNGTAAGFQNTVELTAISALSAAVRDVGTDEITVLSSTYFGPIVLLPDHSGIVAPSGTIAYTHRLFNNTGGLARFDLTVSTQLGWVTEIHADTNGDGVYTPGVDVQISNSSFLSNGGSEIVFVVTTAPGVVAAGVDDVAHLTARSQAGCTPNPACLAYVDSVTDTTTILAATTHDLAGGGTRMAAVGDLTTFPGTIYNLRSSPDSFDFSISASSLFGVDGLNHRTELVVDTNADGVADTLIAVDTNGDGTWDLTCGAGVIPACSAATFKTNGNATLPDVLVAANGKLAYELRRQIDPAQKIWMEYATLTATSVFNNTQKDSVTAEWIIASLSRASIRGLRVDTNGFVEFVTGSQKDTAFFNLYSTADRSLKGEKTLLNTTPVASPMPDSIIPILYKVQTRSIDEPYLIIEETETTGNVFSYGPYSVANTRLLRGLERVEDKMNRFGITDGPVRVARAQNTRRAGALVRSQKLARIVRRSLGSATNGLAIEVSGAGQIAVPIATLQSAGLPMPAPSSGNLSLTRNGQAVPANVSSVEGTQSLVFDATLLTTDYADTSTYILTWPGTGAASTPTANFSVAGDQARPGYVRVERNAIYAVAVAPGSDPWQWGFLIGDGRTWPYADWDPTVGRFDLPNLGTATPGLAPVKIRFVGRTDHHHLVSAQINGYSVGTVSFENQDAAVLEGSVPQAVLRETGNELTFVYRAEHDDGSLASAGYAYMDYVDIAMPTKPVASTAALASVRAYEPKVTGMNGVKYLIVTNSLFREQADRLAALKTAEKLKALVIDVQTAYDRFSGGVTEPNAILKAIREVAQTSGKLEYVVLLGDDTFDPKNYLGADTVSYVPSILGWDGSQRIPNENAYADIDGDGSPDVALGRIPVNTAAEAKIVVDKIETQTTTLAKGGNVHLFASDDSRESDSKFGANAAAMSQLLPATTTSILADVGAAGVGLARNTLFGTWQQGALMTHYFGHGGPEIWTDEALFSVDDVPDLQGHMSPTILLAWACQTQFFQNFYGPSINEAMFLSPASGSLASLGPVGITSPEHQKALYQNVYKWLYTKGLSLGEIIRQAKVAALAENPANKDVVDGFMFLGDPSLSLPTPQFGNPGKGKIPR